LGERTSIYAWYADPQHFPITSRPVYFVFVPNDPLEPLVKKTTMTAITRTLQLPGARLAFQRSGVTMVRWLPPPGTRSVVLPEPG
jgi:hypothetical protein